MIPAVWSTREEIGTVANEIIVFERTNSAYQFYFLYTVPVAQRIEIGGTGATGQYPVLTPSSDLPDAVALVLTLAEKTALDAGEAVIKFVAIPVADDASDADVLATARTNYAAYAPLALAEYQRRYKYIGRRFDAS